MRCHRSSRRSNLRRSQRLRHNRTLEYRHLYGWSERVADRTLPEDNRYGCNSPPGTLTCTDIRSSLIPRRTEHHWYKSSHAQCWRPQHTAAARSDQSLGNLQEEGNNYTRPHRYPILSKAARRDPSPVPTEHPTMRSNPRVSPQATRADFIRTLLVSPTSTRSREEPMRFADRPMRSFQAPRKARGWQHSTRRHPR